MLRPLHRYTPVATLLLALAGCATTVETARNRTQVAPRLPSGAEHARVTDGAIRADFAYIESQQARVRALNDAGRPLDDYGLAKAQCWLSFALDEYHDNDRTGVIEAALAEADRLLGALEAGGAVPRETPIVATATRLREDLWRRSAALDAHPGAACATAARACLEVQLVWAGHEYGETGWRHARHAIAEAERLAADGEARAAACPGAVPTPVCAPAPDACPKAPAAAPAVRRVTLGADALFASGRSDLASMRTEGRRQLDELAATLRGWRSLEAIAITGHADRMGRKAANQALSEARANTVRDYLIGAGLPAAVMSTAGRGDREPVANCAPGLARTARVACLQPDRRVELAIRGEPAETAVAPPAAR